MSRTAGIVAAALAAFACASRAQEMEPSFWNRTLSAINDTTPAGLKPRDERAGGWGWFSDQWEAGKSLASHGRMSLLLPIQTYHSPARYENSEQQNAYPFGAGIASYSIDDRDNERMLFAVAFSDSHYSVEPMAGYAWLARWPLFGGIKGGLGYVAVVSARTDTNWFPVPAVLPLVSLGTDAASLYAVHVPTQYVTFLFARFSADPLSGPSEPGRPDARDTRRNLIYAGYGHVKTDPSGIDGISGSNGSGPVIGYRRYFGQGLAAELAVERSEHTLELPRQALGSFRRTAWTLAAQYHFPITQGAELYAGMGLGYEGISQQQLANAALESRSIGPVVQAGVSVALDSRWTVTGGIRTGFPRHQLTLDGVPAGSVLLAPVTFSLALGARF